MKKLIWLALLAGVALIPGSANAAGATFVASLTHDQEVANPPIPNEGTSGWAVFTLSDDMTSLSYSIKLFGLDLGGAQTPDPNDNAMRMHIHRAPAGTNGGIVFGMIDPSSDLDDLVVDAPGSMVMGAWDGIEGNGTARLSTELANLMNRGLYLNVHTSDHAGGEIRGQIRPIPEPSSIVLGGIGVAALALLARRARARRG